MTNDSSSNPAATMLAFLVGASAGAAAALLFAPRTGQQTREQLQEKARLAREKVQTKLAQQKDRIEEKVSQTANAVGDAVEEGNEAIQKTHGRSTKPGINTTPSGMP